jgi:hypothetical protein
MAVNESLSKLLDKEWEQKSLAEVVKASPAALQGLTDERAQKIAEGLGAKTIADLANNKYVRWAQALASLAEYEA